MSDETKVDFYLQNRALIEEWAGLRSGAASLLDAALMRAGRALGSDESLPTPRIKEGESVRLAITADPLPISYAELWWQRTGLFKGTAGSWPHIVLTMPTKHPKALRMAVRDACAPARETHGLTTMSTQFWLRSGQIVPESEPIEIETYADECAARLRSLWIDFNEVVEATIRDYVGTHGAEA